MASVHTGKEQPLDAFEDLERRLQEFPQRWLPRTGELRDLADRWVAAWNAHDIALLETLVTEDVVWDDPGMLGDTAHGRIEFRAFAEVFLRAFPDVHFEGTGSPLFELGGTSVAVPWRMTGTFTGELALWGRQFGPTPPAFAPTHRRLDVEGVDIYELRDGLVAHWTLRYDLFEVSQQLGLIPASNSRLLPLLVRGQRVAARVIAWRATKPR